MNSQRENGSWSYKGQVRPGNNYDLLETFRQLRWLVQCYRLTREHPAVAAAAEYLLSCQTDEGDLRGILGNQYMPYYHGAIVGLLTQAGFSGKAGVVKAQRWLLDQRQDDGGWIVPLQALKGTAKQQAMVAASPIPPNRSLPFSHLATGMALRAFVYDPAWADRDEVRMAVEALKGRFLKPDRYNDRRASSYWVKFHYPFWWTDLISGMEAAVRIGIRLPDEDLERAVQWFNENQQEDGLWPTGYGKGAQARENRSWVGLAACRVLQACTR